MLLSEGNVQGDIFPRKIDYLFSFNKSRNDYLVIAKLLSITAMHVAHASSSIYGQFSKHKKGVSDHCIYYSDKSNFYHRSIQTDCCVLFILNKKC